MKKLKFLLAFIFVSAISVSTVNAQIFSIGAGGGLTKVSGPDSYTRDITEGGLGFSSEYNFGVLAKVNLPIIPLTPRAFVLYHNFNSQGDIISLPKGNASPDESIEFSQSVLQVGAGLQWEFIPVPVGFSPYFSLDLTYNNFGDFTSKIAGVETTSPGNSRFGLAVGVGTSITILPIINLEVFANYGWFNLIGKEDGEETITAFTLDAFVMFSFL